MGEETSDQDDSAVYCLTCNIGYKTEPTDSTFVCSECGRVIKDVELTMEGKTLAREIINIIEEEGICNNEQIKREVFDRCSHKLLYNITGGPLGDGHVLCAVKEITEHLELMGMIQKVETPVDQYFTRRGWALRGYSEEGDDTVTSRDLLWCALGAAITVFLLFTGIATGIIEWGV